MFTRRRRQPNTIFGAIALMVGNAVGAGIFALPYIFQQAGTAIGLAYVIGLGCILTLVNLAYGEVVLSTNGKHQFVALTEHYLGKRWKHIAVITTVIGYYGALSAFGLEVGNLLAGLLQPWFGGPTLAYNVVYYALVSGALLLGVRAVTAVEKTMMVVMLLLISTFIVLAIPHVAFTNWSLVNPPAFFLPFGVVLFALSASSAVPEMKLVLSNDPKKLRTAILWGSLIPVIIYCVFAVVAVGVTGPDTTESAIAGLGVALGSPILVAGSIFGCITMTTCFLVSGLIFKDVYTLDYKLSPVWSWMLVVVPPFVLLLSQWLSFVELLGVSGGLVGGLSGIIIMRMHRKLLKHREQPSEFTITQSSTIHYVTYGIFIIGIAYESWLAIQRLL